MTPSWLSIARGDAPLIIAMPHAGCEIPPAIAADLVSPWLARKDSDWRVEQLYAMARSLDATILRTAICRAVIDVNRDPSGASLYPGQATTDLCPLTTFDGEVLYKAGREPDAADIAARRETYFMPYHAAVAAEIKRLRQKHPRIVLYDAHAIRSRIPRLFDGELPHFNIGSNRGGSCDPELTKAIEAACRASGFAWVTNGRFVGGWTTRHYGAPALGVHAIQMEIAMRAYLDEPAACTPDNWPPAYDPERAGGAQLALATILQSCITFAR
jgi:N-formylglutamate deformylase